MNTTHHPLARRESVPGHLLRAFAGLLLAWDEALRHRRDRAHLESLPDYLLRDVGLDRAGPGRAAPDRS
jgi:uncharacterized protein YjiS (DUF1127 family)